MVRTRCKFTVSQISFIKSSRYLKDDEGEQITNEDGTPKWELFKQPTVSLSAVTSDDPESENGRFWTASPSGSISLTINNPAGAEVFEVGDDFYVDFIRADG